MKFFIWAIPIFLYAVLRVAIEDATGATIALPIAFLITIPVFFVAPALSKKQDAKKKEQEEKNSFLGDCKPLRK